MRNPSASAVLVADDSVRLVRNGQLLDDAAAFGVEEDDGIFVVNRCGGQWTRADPSDTFRFFAHGNFAQGFSGHSVYDGHRAVIGIGNHEVGAIGRDIHQTIAGTGMNEWDKPHAGNGDKNGKRSNRWHSGFSLKRYSLSAPWRARLR